MVEIELTVGLILHLEKEGGGFFVERSVIKLQKDTSCEGLTEPVWTYANSRLNSYKTAGPTPDLL